MKIVTWNCRDKFNEKKEYARQFGADVLIVPESRKASVLPSDKGDVTYSTSAIWIGDENTKGIGVFSFGGYKLTIAEEYSCYYKHVVPIWIYGPVAKILLFAVWTHPPYAHQVIGALEHYKFLLNQHSIIIAGDFNTNAKWDSLHKTKNHSVIVAKLSDHNIHSVYHHFFKENHGAETLKTHRHSSGHEFHIDYCFVSQSILNRLVNVEIGEFLNSDHAPLSSRFQLDS